MNLPPPPPEPAFSQWCATQANPTGLCLDAPTAAQAWSLEMWVLFLLLALMYVGIAAYVVSVSRRAHIGGRFVNALGGYEPAARHLGEIEEQNETRLAGALSIHAFTKEDTQ